MFNLDDEDDDDFAIRPETSSKLANLFETNELNLDIESSNKSLKYIPPKQPKKFEISGNPSDDNSTNTSVMTLIHASAVNVFKFENGKYTAQGKLGAALLGNHDTGSYKLILYTGKQQHITFASINENFKLICQPNNYFSFYDDNRQNWSVMFDTEEEKLNFSRQLTVCKFNTISKIIEKESNILTQDLVVGNENSPIVAEDNDNIELRYKGWLFEEYQTLGKLFANVDNSAKKPFRIKLIGKWTQLLKGMRIGGKRFAVFAPNIKEQLTGILENAPIGQNCKYGFDFELIKIQPRIQQKPQIDSKPQKESKEHKKNKESDEERVDGKRSHSGSVSESVKADESQSKPKSDILSRVSKMGGLPIFPMRIEPKQTEQMDTTDTNEEEITQSKPFPKPRNSSIGSIGSQSNDSQIASNNSNQRIPDLYSQIINSHQMPVNTSTATSIPFQSYFAPQSLETSLTILTTESRSNQTEMRSNLNKIIDKIDSVSEKVNEIKNSSTPQMNSMSGIGFMDSAILLSSIQRIVTENNTLKKEVEEKTSNLQKLNEKIVDLLHVQNIQNTSVQKNNSQELDRLLVSETRLKSEIRELTENCDRFRAKNEELNEENSRLMRTVEQLRTELENRPNVSRESASGHSKDTLVQIKKLMNDVFRKINAQIDENMSYKSEEIIEIVSNSIRSTTLPLMESRNNSRTNSPFRQSVDEIDKNKEISSPKQDINKEAEKPPIPQRKSIEGQQQNSKNSDSSQEFNEESKQEVENTE